MRLTGNMVLFLFYDCATTPCSGPRSSPLYQSGVRALSKIHDRTSMILLSPSSHASSDCLVYLVREPSCDTPKSQFPMWTQSVWLLTVRFDLELTRLSGTHVLLAILHLARRSRCHRTPSSSKSPSLPCLNVCTFAAPFHSTRTHLPSARRHP